MTRYSAISEMNAIFDSRLPWTCWTISRRIIWCFHRPPVSSLHILLRPGPSLIHRHCIANGIHAMRISPRLQNYSITFVASICNTNLFSNITNAFGWKEDPRVRRNLVECACHRQRNLQNIFLPAMWDAKGHRILANGRGAKECTVPSVSAKRFFDTFKPIPCINRTTYKTMAELLGLTHSAMNAAEASRKKPFFDIICVYIQVRGHSNATFAVKVSRQSPHLRCICEYTPATNRSGANTAEKHSASQVTWRNTSKFTPRNDPIGNDELAKRC